MKQIKSILSILLVSLAFISCQESYDMIPVPEPPEIPDARFKTMFMVGDATPNGWDLNGATALSPTADNPNIFTWNGNLNEGELKFSIDKQDDWQGAWFLAPEPGVVVNGEAQPMNYSASGDGGQDHKWKIPATGTYTIELDALNETVKIWR